MPRILLPNGATRWVPVLNPGDVPVSGESALGRVKIAGQESSQISSAPVIAQGQDEGAAAVEVPGIFSPKFRRVTSPEITPAKTVQRQTTRSSY